MHIAVQGCCHGSLTEIYNTVAEYESRKGAKVDLLLLCGDFQALRNTHDFASLAVPPKYHALGTFHEYYSGKRVAPVLTLVIGGNHEASNYMWELYHGGWLAPNIYYMGAAGSVLVNGLRIVGASGIYKPHDYHKGHFETVPYNKGTLRSIYHIREYDVVKLSHLPSEVDAPTLFMSHDWPIGIAHHGDKRRLLERKPFFKSEVQKDTLGSPPLLELLKTVKPDYWFAAHLHVKFAAMYPHKDGAIAETQETQERDVPAAPPVEEGVGQAEAVAGENPDEIEISLSDDDVPPSPTKPFANPDEIAISDDEGNPDEIAISLSDDGLDAADAAMASSEPATATAPASEPVTSAPQESSASTSTSSPPKVTRFLALDKCGPGKDFIQFLEIKAPLTQSPPRLTYDPHWLAITRALHPYMSLEVHPGPLPPRIEQDALVADELVRIKEEGVLVPEDLMEDLLLAEMDAEFEADARRATETEVEGKGESKAVSGGSASGASTSSAAAAASQASAPARTEPAGGSVENRQANGANTEAEKVPQSDGDREEDLPQFAPLAWEDASDIEVGRVQQFWPTAPPYPGGEPNQWYTNPQTEAFCGMLGIQNKVNPRPVER